MPSTHTELTETEREALHELALGLENVHRGYGALVACHHYVGRGMNHFDRARELLRSAGHDEPADRLRDEILPAGLFEDRWTYELVDDAREGFLRDVTDFEAAVRADLADGRSHVAERAQQRAWRRRADR